MKKITFISLILSLGLLGMGCVANTKVTPGPSPENLETETYTEDYIEEDELEANNLEDESVSEPNEIKAILTDSLDKVQTLKVLYPVEGNYVEARYESSSDISIIKKIYNSIESTKTKYHKVSPEAEGQQSNPTFKIQIYYSSGRIDRVDSTETGVFIFRNTSSINHSWIGGKNTELQYILGDGVWLYKKEYSEAGESINRLLSDFRRKLKDNNLEAAKLLTENVKDEAFEAIKGGDFDVTGALIYHQDGSISVITIDRREERIKNLSFTLIKDQQQNWKINDIEFDVDFY